MCIDYQIIFTCFTVAVICLFNFISNFSSPLCHSTPSSPSFLLSPAGYFSCLWSVTFTTLFSFTAPYYSSMLPPLCTLYLCPSFPIIQSLSFSHSVCFLKVFYVNLLTNLYLLFSSSPLNLITPLSVCSFSVFLYLMFYLHAPFSASSRPKCPSNSRCMRLPGGDSSFHDNSRLRG